jgi:hypothetical protein
MPLMRPAGLTHLLPGEQSVSKPQARACALESANAIAASLNCTPSLFTGVTSLMVGSNKPKEFRMPVP